MEKTIVVELTRVARRISLLRWGWSLAILLAALVTAVLATISFRGESVVLSKDFWGPAAVAAAMWLLVSAILIWRFAPSRLQVAQRIESQYPELRQSLLTSIDPQANLWANPLLTREAVRASNRHRMLHRWTAIIPTWQYAAVGAAQLLVMASALAVGGWLTVRYAEGRSEKPAPKLAAGETLRVEPGDVEIERGSSITVAATFAGPPPIEVELGSRDKPAEVEPRFGAMRQRLRDPIYTALLSNVREDLEYWVRHDGDESKRYTIRVFDYPALQRTDASLKYPAYTARESETIDDTRRVRIVEGTTVRWTLQVNKPAIAAAMVGPDETRLTAKPDADDPLRLTVAMDSPAGGRWRIELIDSEGRRAKLEESVMVTVVPNLPPQIKLTAGADASVSPLEEWLAAADVNDDFGVIRSGLSYSFHGDQVELEVGTPKEPPAAAQASPQPDVALGAVELQTVAADTQRTEVSNRFDMERLSAEVDDSLTYWFWADDYDAAGNVRRTRSDLYFADVRSLEEIFRQGQPPPGGQPGQQGQQAGGSQATEELLELQRNIVAATWKLQGRSDSGEADDALAADVETIRQSQQAAVEKLAEAASRQNDPRSQQIVADVDTAMQEAVADIASFTAKSDQAGDADPLDEDPLDEALGAEQAAYQGLLKLRAREFEISQSQQSQSQGGGAAGAARQRQIDQLKLDAEQNRYETQSQAQQPQDPAAAEADREMLDRLKQLAQRQTDLNEQIRQLEAALQAAQTPEERQEAEEQLKRLRDAQQQLLRDADEALDQMQQNQQSQQSQQNAQQQLSEARQNMQQAAEALQQGQPSQALSAGTRGQQSLQKSEEELRSQSAERLTDSLRELRSQSQGLAERQQQIREALQEQNADEAGGSLRGGETRQQLEQDAAQQIQELQQLQERMQETVLQAETAEPLLADSLYDAFRKTQQQQLDEQLQMQSTLINNSMDPEATRFSGRAAQALEQLQQEIGEASANLLGSDTADLERAVDQLQELKDQIAAEASAATGRPVGQANGERRGGGSPQPGEPQPGEPQPQDSQGGQSASGQQPEGQQGGEQPSGEQPSGEQPGSEQPGGEQPGSERQPGEQQSSEQPPGGQQGSGQQPGGAGQQPGSGQRGVGSNGSGRSGSSPNGSSPNGSGPGGGVRGGADAGGGFEAGVGGLLEQLQADSQRRQQAADSPLTGDAFREWNDSLRGVEQLLDNEEDRAAAANVRQAARNMRSEVRRHASEPNWEAVEELIVDPLDDLIERVGEELRRRQGGDDLVVPLDRDPVPPGFEQAVRMYYENLGAGR